MELLNSIMISKSKSSLKQSQRNQPFIYLLANCLNSQDVLLSLGSRLHKHSEEAGKESETQIINHRLPDRKVKAASQSIVWFGLATKQ